MSHTCLYSHLLLAAGMILPCMSADAQKKPPNAKEMQVAISDGVLSVNRQMLRCPFSRQDLNKLIGEPSRHFDGANTIYTWDELGICAYTEPKKNDIVQVTFSLRKERFDFSPKINFSGKLTLDNTLVTADSSFKEINESRKGARFKKAVDCIPNWWVIEYPSSKIYIETLENNANGIVYITFHVNKQ